jgi:hypothetical protein
MSKLVTTIPVAVQEVLSALPSGSYVHSVKLKDDKSGIEIVWDNPRIITKFSFPVAYPLEELQKRVHLSVDDKGQKRGKK